MDNKKSLKLNTLSRRYPALLVMALLGALYVIVACEHDNIIHRKHVAMVNGEKIYLDEYRERLNVQKGIFPPGSFPDAPDRQKRLEQEILESLITEKIVLQRARELNLTVSKAELEGKLKNIRKDYGDNFFDLFRAQKMRYEDWCEELKKEMLMDKLIATDVNASVRVSEYELENYYHDHPGICRTETHIRASQVMVRNPAKAEAIRERLINGENFASVASRESLGPEAARGGDLGWINRQMMPDPLDKTLFRLPQGQISPVIKSAYGYHIFKVTEIQPARTKPFSECRTEIAAVLRELKEDAAFAVWLDALKMKAEVKRETNMLDQNVNHTSRQGG